MEQKNKREKKFKNWRGGGVIYENSWKNCQDLLSRPYFIFKKRNSVKFLLQSQKYIYLPWVVNHSIFDIIELHFKKKKHKPQSSGIIMRTGIFIRVDRAQNIIAWDLPHAIIGCVRISYTTCQCTGDHNYKNSFTQRCDQTVAS